MYCPGCGKNIPFSGDACPYCLRDTTVARKYYLGAIIGGLFCWWIGSKIFDFWIGLLCMAAWSFAVYIKLGTLQTPTPAYRATSTEQSRQRQHQKQEAQATKIATQEDVISFSYSDAFGEATKRTIEVDQIYESAGRVYIDGFCRLREDTRTFRVDRIIGDIFLYGTNERISPERYCQASGIEFFNDEEEEPYAPPTQYWGDGDYVPVKATLAIEGVDVAGRKKRSILNITEYNGSSWINGFCENSQRRETFLVEKIDSCVDLAAGTVINNIPQFLREKYHESPGYILGQAAEKLSDILSVLYYVGKADGQLRAEERKILRAVVRKIAKHDEITDAMIDKCFNRMTVPSLQAVKLAINRICKSSGHNMAITYKIAQQIVATQKTVHPSEVEILEYMQRKMAKEGIDL